MRRLGVVALGVVVAIAGIVALAIVFNSRDDADLAEAPAGPGSAQAAGEGEFPTSGPHERALVTREGRELTDDQLLTALELGNIVILYEGRAPAPELVQLQEDLAGPFDAEIAAAGQAVILAPAEGAGPATALAWERVLQADDPGDPELTAFAEAWLGRGLGN